MALHHEVQVALSSDFLKAFAKLPKAQQRKVRQWIEKFQIDPTQKSLNYESIQGTRDEKVRTARIDQCYRIVIIHPPKGQVYLCVWVDHHDDAMDWAMRKVFEVNPRTGSFQVWEPISGESIQVANDVVVAECGKNEVPKNRLLSGFDDTDLLMVGVPEPLLPAVRALRSDSDLEELCRFLPRDASDALYLLAAGYSVDACLAELLREIDKDTISDPTFTEEQVNHANIDTNDFATALARPESRQIFKLVQDDEELAAILDAPLEQWRIFLHPSQEKIVHMKSSGSARVLGGAGTGKTVVAMHRARYLAAHVFSAPEDRVLFTTFTANLARDIQDNLKRLCGDEMQRIEVTNLHAWCARFLRDCGLKLQGKIASPDQMKRFWEEVQDETIDACHFSFTFMKEEWDKVVQAQNVSSLADYLRARRAGRGTRITRSQRKEIWQVFSVYRTKLDRAGKLEPDDLIRLAYERIIDQKSQLPYRAIIADEVQDFRTADLQLLRAMVPKGENDIFVVGDAHQRIYGHKASLSRCGISVQGRRSRRLKINYRTTERIRQWAVGRLEGLSIDDLDEGQDDRRGEHSLRLGVKPKYRLFDGPEQEAQALLEIVRGWYAEGVAWEEMCITTRWNKNLKQRYLKILEQAGILAVQIKKESTDTLGAGIRVASMHRVKGLEFPRVLIVGVHRDGESQKRRYADDVERALHLESERKLLYVAATRARDELVVMGFGQCSPLLADIVDHSDRDAA